MIEIDHLLLLIATVGVLITGAITAGIQLRRFVMGLRRERDLNRAERDSVFLAGAATATRVMSETLKAAHDEITYWHSRVLELEKESTRRANEDD